MYSLRQLHGLRRPGLVRWLGYHEVQGWRRGEVMAAHLRAQYVAVAALASALTASSADSSPLILLGLFWLGLKILSVPSFDGMLVAASGALALVAMAMAARAGATPNTAEAELVIMWECTGNAILVAIGASQLFSLRYKHVCAIIIAMGGSGILIGCSARHAPATALLRPLVVTLAVVVSCLAWSCTRESERRQADEADGASAEKTGSEVSTEGATESNIDAAAVPVSERSITQPSIPRGSDHASDTVEASLVHLERQVQDGSPHSMMLQAMSGGKDGTVAQQRLANFLHDIDDLVAKGTPNGSTKRSSLTHRIGALRHIASSIEIADAWFERMRDSSFGLDLDFKFNLRDKMQASEKTKTNSCRASQDDGKQTDLDHFTYDVFLGGSCDPTTWRKDTAIPRMSAVGLQFYNPQVDVWTPELVEVEREAKEHAAVLFFVIDNHTRAVASLLEAAEFICRGRQVTLVINEIEAGSTIDNCIVGEREAADLNRGRSYLREVAQRHGVRCFDRVDEATDHVCKSYEVFTVVSKRESFLRKVLTPRSTMRELRKLRQRETQRLERRRSAVDRQSPRVSLKNYPKHASTGNFWAPDERHVVNHQAAERLAQNLVTALNLDVHKS